MILPKVVLILEGVIPLDIAIHTQSAWTRFAYYCTKVDIWMILLEVASIIVEATPLENAIQTQCRASVRISVMSLGFLYSFECSSANIAGI